MNWHNIGPFSAFFLENALFCGYTLLAALSACSVIRLLKLEELSQKQKLQPVYFQRTILNKTQQKISLLLLLLALAGILVYQPASFTVNSILSRFFDCSIFLLGSETWENFIVFVVLPLATFNFIGSVGSTIWLSKLIHRLSLENVLEQRSFIHYLVVAILEWCGIIFLTAGLICVMRYYS
ncbi:hypothetical protein SAMN02745213_00971 [Succinivibrio dextrinosolvens DSM 3072]|uniref:Uncharacterized protein n=1 Tax=Succinivibrio dextrinosolvens DSM 3072 TaxID=1123324 RepID=A0A1T4V7G3_9GAMM|nr:hypothetical protein [Succinivibrio dextrinosolvens]SKA60883.1 hypothetical protein SAMN02745213_00971 [Succinivibrio dextrinosolvens DSM 3072]